MNPEDQKPQEPTQNDQSQESTTPDTTETPTAPTETETPTVVPVPPVSTPAPKDGDTSQANSAGQIVLQWLTYAFWGWTLLALSVLASLVIQNLINQFDASGAIPYVLAAVLVLLPLSFVCDLFYRKHEPRKKHGAAMVVMVIHTVIFALFGIGALIFSVFSLVQALLATSSVSSSATTASIISSLVIAALYGITFLRTLNPLNNSAISKFYGYAMLGVAGIFIVLSFIGPVAQSAMTKDDRRIEAQLSNVKYAVDNHIRKNNTLPANLSELDLKEDAKAIVDEGLVTYKSDGQIETTGSTTPRPEYRFQLCATFKKESKDYGRYNDYNTEEYSSYVSTYNHPAGEVCYKLNYVKDSYVY